MADYHVHYWGWAPGGNARRCGATEGRCTRYRNEVSCPACITLLDQQVAHAIIDPEERRRFEERDP